MQAFSRAFRECRRSQVWGMEVCLCEKLCHLILSASPELTEAGAGDLT